LFKRDDGSLTLKLDCIPVGAPDWNGWISFYDIDNNRQQSNKSASGPHFDDQGKGQGFDDDIPF
jgi:hypothetical protein